MNNNNIYNNIFYGFLDYMKKKSSKYFFVWKTFTCNIYM